MNHSQPATAARTSGAGAAPSEQPVDDHGDRRRRARLRRSRAPRRRRWRTAAACRRPRGCPRPTSSQASSAAGELLRRRRAGVRPDALGELPRGLLQGRDEERLLGREVVVEQGFRDPRLACDRGHRQLVVGCCVNSVRPHSSSARAPLVDVEPAESWTRERPCADTTLPYRAPDGQAGPPNLHRRGDPRRPSRRPSHRSSTTSSASTPSSARAAHGLRRAGGIGPAVTIFGSARTPPDHPEYEQARDPRAAARRGGLPDHHRRRARRDGGGQPGGAGGRRAVGRTRHRAPARGAAQPLRRPAADVPLLLHAQGDVRPLRLRVRVPARRFRDAGRALRGADAAPDAEDPGAAGDPGRARTIGAGLIGLAGRTVEREGKIDANDIASDCSAPTTSTRSSPGSSADAPR